MALNNLGLGVTFTARDAMSGVLGRLQRAFSGLETTSRAAVATIGAGFAAMAAGIGVVSAGLGGLEGAMNLASVAGRFQASITRVGLVANDASTGGLKMMGDAALNAAQASGFATGEVTQGLEDIAAMGFTSAQSVQMLNPALGLAAAGAISVADAASAMGSAMKVFGLEVTEASMNSTASKLLGIANTTALQAHDLRIALGTVGRGASAAKQDLDEMLIAMGLVKNTGVDATVAASSVSSALLFMAENADKFDKIGVKVEDADGHFRDFLDVVLDVSNALEDTGSDAQAVSTIKDLFQRFGITAYQGVATQLKTGIFDEATGKTYYMADAVKYLREQLQKSADQNIALTHAQKMLEGFEGTTKRLSASWETLKITVGTGFAETFLPALKLVVDGIIAMERGFRSLSPSAKKFAAATFVAAMAMTVAAGAALAFSGAIAAIIAGVIFMSPAFLAFLGWAAVGMAAFTAASVALAGALTVLGGGIYAIYSQNLGGAMDHLVNWWNRTKTIYQSVVGLFQSGELRGAAAEAFDALDDEAKQMVVDFTLTLMKLEVFVKSFWERFKEVIVDVGIPALDRLWDAFMRFGVALGVVDNQAYEMSKTLGSDDFAIKGKIAAEAVANAFVKIADSLSTTINALAWVIEKVDYINKKNEEMEAAQSAGGAWRAFKAFWGDDEAQAEIDAGAPVTVQPTKHVSPQMAAYRPIKTAAEIAAERAAAEAAAARREENEAFADKMSDKMVQERKESGNATQTVYLIIDGEVIATAVDKTKSGQRAGHFAQGTWGSGGNSGDW